MPPRSKQDILGNIRLMKFLMEYYNAIDQKIFEISVHAKDPDAYNSDDVLKFIKAMEGFQKRIDAIANGQRAGRDTSALEDSLIRDFMTELTEKARVAVEKSSAPEIAGVVPRELMFDGIHGMLKKYGGDKIAALVHLSDRLRSFDESLDGPPKPKPPKPF